MKISGITLPSIKLSEMKIVNKIILSFLIILVLSFATIGFLIYELKAMQFIMMDKLYSTFMVANLSLQSEKALKEFDINIQSFISALENENKEEAMNYTAPLHSSYKSVTDLLTGIKKWIKDEKGKQLLVDVEDLYIKMWENIEKDFDKQLTSGDFDAVFLQTIGALKGRSEEFIKGFVLMNLEAKEIADKSYNAAQESIKKVILISVIISLILLAVALLVAIFISGNISKSLYFFKEIFSKGASGHLNASYPVNNKARDEINELGLLFNNFMENVRGVIKEVVDVSNELGASSEELSGTLVNFSNNSQSQAASSEEITATMEEISAGVDNVSDNSQYQCNELNEFIHLMQELSGIINNIAERISNAQGLSKNITMQAQSGNESLNLMNKSMTNITESSNKVSDIVGIIDDISNQINLLSLNAAIEAARAGEAGRGFAVVADEISKLADQTASSINDIDSLIKKNNKEINSGTKNVTDSIESTSQIIVGVQSIDDMMNKIVTFMEKQQSTNMAVNKSADNLRIRSDEVRVASGEQKNAVGEVMKSITNINELLQASAAGSEQMTANANRLASLAEHLKNKVSFFNING